MIVFSFKPFSEFFLACIWIEAFQARREAFCEAGMDFRGGMLANHHTSL